MEATEFFENRELIVFAADQKAFSTKNAYACTLYPLMTLAGDPIDVDIKNFPNNCRVWWHLGGTSPELVVPGAILVGELEKHPEFDKFDAKKSYYQAGHDKRLNRGHAQLIEILDLDVDSPDIDLIRQGRKLPFNRPPVGTVILRGRNKTVGPLKCTWETVQQAVTLSPLAPANSTTWIMNTREFDEIVKKRSFTIPINEAAYYGDQYKLKLSLTRQEWFNEDVAKKIGKVIDISTDDQIVNWAVQTKVFEATNAEKSTIKRFTTSVLENAVEISDLKFERLQVLAKDFERMNKLGEEAATIIAKSPAFEALLKKHIDKVVEKDVAREKQERRAELEQAIAPLEKRKKNLNRDIKELEERLGGIEEEHRKTLKEQETVILGGVRKREIELEAKVLELARKEEIVTKALEEATERYVKHASSISGEVLTHLPFLKEFFGSATGLATQVTVQSQQPLPSSAHERVRLPEPRPRQVDHRITETDFLDQFVRIVEDNGFVFRQDDLINFHVCMKVGAGALTILSGMSGTGKSSLPRFYAKAMGAYEEYLEVPVRPDWLDDRDLMGFFNPLSQAYEPGRSGLVTQLITAEKDFKTVRSGFYITCLDEMNLARVEHYFAPFLSVLEKDPDDRTMTLYPHGLGSENDPFAPHRQISLGGNLRFVGTVNIDETTHFFSPKLIDRAQIVSLAGNGLLAQNRRNGHKSRPIIPVSYDTYTSWTQGSDSISSGAEQFLRDIHSTLRPSRIGFEHRSFHRMLDYVTAALPLMSEDKALDYQLTQIVFPKLRRSAPLFKKTLGELQAQVPQTRFPRSAEILQRLADADNEEDYFQLI